MKTHISIDPDTMREALDCLHTLKGEWSWKQDEPRAGNKREYYELLATIHRMEEALREAEKHEKDQDRVDSPGS